MNHTEGDSKLFAYIVDNEVAWLHRVNIKIEPVIAVLQSNPTVVEVPEEISEDINFSGWTYENNIFVPPSNE